MAGWSHVKWTRATQVGDLMALDLSWLEDAEASPETAFRKLRERGELGVAVNYLGHALPRLEAVAWATRLVGQWSRARDAGAEERQALDSVERWLDEPTEDYRRAAHDAARRAPDGSAEGILAYAAFMSGGSISEPDLPPVQPPPEVCGGLAASAVTIAAYRSASPEEALGKACDVGDEIAGEGVKALAAG